MPAEQNLPVKTVVEPASCKSEHSFGLSKQHHVLRLPGEEIAAMERQHRDSYRY